MKRILIIDDDEQIRDMLRQLFEREHFEVLDAADGENGIKIYRKQPPDLVITDIIMPEKEGIETIHLIRQEFPDAKIIAMSGGGRIGPEAYLKIAKTMGASWTFTKPINRKHLLEAVREILDS